ncbi:MAG: hypothetical protein PHV80_04300 [Rugosibacter sp.]|nr:hypothetical protein [Rugosibacter sp.]
MGRPQTDTRPDQAARVADFLELHPYATLKEIDAACDTGCASKVLSDMRPLGYGIARQRRDVLCVGGLRSRKVQTYALTYRPDTQPDLFNPL